MKIHHGDVFKFPPENGATFKVIDMSADQVVLQQLDNKQMWTVPKPEAPWERRRTIES